MSDLLTDMPAPEGESESTQESKYRGHPVRAGEFEGPLDLLLHLVRANEVEITDIPIVTITEQYNEYLDLMAELNLELAGEYLVMASTLMYIKSRMLLPPDPENEDGAEDEDPRADLAQQLIEYQRFKQAAENLQAMDSRRSLIWTRDQTPEEFAGEELLEVDLFDVRPDPGFPWPARPAQRRGPAPVDEGHRVGGRQDQLAHGPAATPTFPGVPATVGGVADAARSDRHVPCDPRDDAFAIARRLPAQSAFRDSHRSGPRNRRRPAARGERGGSRARGNTLSRQQSDPVSAELLVPAVGALLFASGEPVGTDDIAKALGGVERAQVDEAIEALSDQYRRTACGLRVESVAGGFRLTTEIEVGAWVRRFFQQRNRTRLTPAALETLAIVAYRQPVTSPEIQAIRGKDPSASLRSLLDKKLIRILGKKKVVGNPILYGTQKNFLVHFGLNSLGDLPSIDDFDEFVGLLEAGQAGMFERAGGVTEDEASAAAGHAETPVSAPSDSPPADEVR